MNYEVFNPKETEIIFLMLCLSEPHGPLVFVTGFVSCVDHPESGVALTGCGSGTIGDLFLKSSGEIQPEQLDSLNAPTTDCNHIKRANPHGLLGRGKKLLN